MLQERSDHQTCQGSSSEDKAYLHTIIFQSISCCNISIWIKAVDWLTNRLSNISIPRAVLLTLLKMLSMIPSSKQTVYKKCEQLPSEETLMSAKDWGGNKDLFAEFQTTFWPSVNLYGIETNWCVSEFLGSRAAVLSLGVLQKSSHCQNSLQLMANKKALSWAQTSTTKA